MTKRMSITDLWWNMIRSNGVENYPEFLEVIKQYRGTLDIARARFGQYRHSFIHYACAWNMYDILEELIEHHNVDVTSLYRGNVSPMHMAAKYNARGCARLLLMHPLVNLNEPDGDGRSPFWHALHEDNGDDHILKLMIASGKTISISMKCFEEDPPQNCVDLVRQFQHDPAGTRNKCCKGVWWPGAALFFANIVFLSDGLLQLKPGAPSEATRFFNIVKDLPMELQMVICHRMTGSGETLIAAKHREAAFKSLAKAFSS